MIDLHTHSCFSDGTDTPEELVTRAVAGGLQGLALTDHDTVAGVPRLLAAARQQGLEAIGGVEVSTTFASGEMHLLGYCVDHNDPHLTERLAWVRTGRRARNEAIVQKLKQLGLPLTWSAIKAQCAGDVVGRPHLAQAMVQRGYVRNAKEAFNRYLARGAAAYVARRTLTAAEAITVIRQAGGVPVLAHPCTLELSRESLRTLLEELQSLGLGGLEVHYPQHDHDQTLFYAGLAHDLNLIATGGTDYHGARTPDLKLGRGFGQLAVPPDTLHLLTQRRPAGRKA